MNVVLMCGTAEHYYTRKEGKKKAERVTSSLTSIHLDPRKNKNKNQKTTINNKHSSNTNKI